MIDLVKLTLKAGDGGNGRVSFRREKYIPKGGPDGGNGGDGGSIIVRGNKGMTTLRHISHVKDIKTEAGHLGGDRKKHGPKGESTVIEVPVGTIFWLVDENYASYLRRTRIGMEHVFKRSEIRFKKYYLEQEGQRPEPRPEIEEIPETVRTLKIPGIVASGAKNDRQNNSGTTKIKLVEILEHGQEVVICQGGFGGRGNDTFKSSVNQVPLEAEYGTAGEVKEVVIELKMLADVGLVGFPNAGKSTLLSKVTKANPKIANYPFTTIEPNLGIMDVGMRADKIKNEAGVANTSLIMADIPGLIEGASEGKGLGDEFLRHVEHCGVLLYVFYLDEHIVFDKNLSDSKKAQMVWKQYQDLKNELKQYEQKRKKWVGESEEEGDKDESQGGENSMGLLEKPYLLSFNKIDIYNKELIDIVVELFNKKDEVLITFSGVTGEGLGELKKKCVALILKLKFE